MDTKIINAIKDALNNFTSHLGVVSTVTDENKPHVASVYFAFNDSLNIYFVTRSSTRKYSDALKNPNIAFLVTSENPPRTVQISGTVSEVTEPSEQEKYFSEVSKIAHTNSSHPPFAQMMNAEIMLMKITPTWARLGDFDQNTDHEMFQETTF